MLCLNYLTPWGPPLLPERPISNIRNGWGKFCSIEPKNVYSLRFPQMPIEKSVCCYQEIKRFVGASERIWFRVCKKFFLSLFIAPVSPLVFFLLLAFVLVCGCVCARVCGGWVGVCVGVRVCLGVLVCAWVCTCGCLCLCAFACSEEELHNLRHLFPQEGLKTLNLALLFKSPGTQKGAKVTLNLKQRDFAFCAATYFCSAKYNKLLFCTNKKDLVRRTG